MFHRLKLHHCFKSPPLVGLDLGRDEIRLLALQKTAAGFQIEKCIYQPLLAAATEGKITHWKLVKSQLAIMVSEAGLSGYPAALALPSAVVIRKQIQLPAYLKEENMQNEIQSRLLEYLPGMPEAELYFDYRLEDTQEEMHQILLVAARKSQLEPYLEAVAEAGLKVTIVDIDIDARIRAALRYLALSRATEQNALAFLDLQASVSSLMVFEQGEMLFHQIWQSSPFPNGFLSEFKKAWQLYTATYQTLPVEKIYATGGIAELASCLRLLEENFPLSTQCIDPLQGLRHSPVLDRNLIDQAASRFLLCCGLALRAS